ncbi:MAG TPA: HypC/HybG/HupF family hydrogenase formation chaperone [Thermoanaerobaculia bacterium]|nr:HypC/HybG/HupF family hydrogenase formation chaperone [Thermoanaerobaculia bacterium]
MCLGIPGEILELRVEKGLPFGKVKFGGITRSVCLAYVPEASVGEFVVVHVGFAISIIDAEEAAQAYKILEEIGQIGELTADLPPDILANLPSSKVQ